MAETRLTGEAVAALLNTRLEGITDQISQKCPLFADLKKAGIIKFGKGWVDGVEFTVHTANSLEASVVSMQDWQPAVAVVANDKRKITAPGSNLVFALGTSAMRDERLNNLDDKTKVFDLLLSEQNEGKQAMTRVFCRDLYGDGSQRSAVVQNTLAPTVGLEGMIADNNTYLAIDRTAGGGVTNAWWKSQVKTVTTFLASGGVYAGTYDGIAKMRQISNQIELLGYTDEKGVPAGLSNDNEQWDAIYTDQTGFERYQGTFDSRMQFNVGIKGSLESNFAPPFKGKPVQQDAFCTASRMYFVQWKALKFWSVKAREIFGIICRDNVNLVQAVIMNSQHVLWSQQPRVLGKLIISG